MSITRKLSNWCFHYVGSTRSAALIRIALALMIWYRFNYVGFSNLFHHHHFVFWAVLQISTFCMLIGYRSRVASLVSGFVVLVTYYYFYQYHRDMAWAHHHTYFIGFDAILLSLAPCGGSYSVDRFLARQRAARLDLPAPAEEGNLLGMRLLAIQIATLYFFAFWDKTFVADTNDVFYGFFNGSRLQQIFLFEYYGSNFQFQPWMNVLGAVASYSVAGLELVLPLLLIERFQKWLVLPGLSLHLAFYFMLPLQIYSLTCMLMYLAIIDANKIHGLLELIGPDKSHPPEESALTADEPNAAMA